MRRDLPGLLPAFCTASNKSWVWRPGNEGTQHIPSYNYGLVRAVYLKIEVEEQNRGKLNCCKLLDDDWRLYDDFLNPAFKSMSLNKDH